MKNEKMKPMAKEAIVKRLERHGFKLPKDMYATASHLQAILDSLEGRGKKTETDADIDSRLRERFETMDHLVNMAIEGVARSIIISGAPGLGKSFNIERRLAEYDPTGNKYTIVRGFSTAVNLYKALWDSRHEGHILVLDDCDAVRKTEEGMNLLKVATDTLDRREVSYLSEGVRISEKDQSRVPNRFEFCGTLIFITNEDMDAISQEDSLMAAHMQALMSRGHYCDLTLRTRREAMIRIKQVISQGLLNAYPEKDRISLMGFVEKHKDHFRDLSLRTVIKIAQFQKTSPDRWEQLARVTCIPT